MQQYNGTNFREHFIGARKKIIVYNRLAGTNASDNRLSLGNLPRRRFIAFLGRFNKQLYKRFRTIPELYDIDINFTGMSRGKNEELWSKMPNGSYFYNLDIKKAYWQIGYRLNYLDHEFYMQYINDDLFKTAMRYCYSFLARKNYMVYHHDMKKTEIQCDTSALKKVYKNVREQLYKEIYELKLGLTTVEYNIDGFSVLAPELATAQERFKEKGILFKIVECQKIDEYTYLYGKEQVKNFKLKKLKNN